MKRLITILFLGITFASAQVPARRQADPYINQLSTFVQQHITGLYTTSQNDEALFYRITAPCGGKSLSFNPEVKALFLAELKARIDKDLSVIFLNPDDAGKRFSGKPQLQVFKDAQVFLSSRLIAADINRKVAGLCNLPPPARKNNPPQADAGKDIFITLPVNSVRLNGRVSDPDNDGLTVRWQKWKGPENDIINSPNSVGTTVANLQEGIYQYILSVNDNGGLYDYDTVMITVSAPQSKPPVANAGKDFSLILPLNTAELDGSGSIPNGNPITYRWIKLGGLKPGEQILNSQSPSPTVTGLNQGIHHFVLIVSNRFEQSDQDSVVITVYPQSVRPNADPIADAGQDQSISLPLSRVQLTGSASDPDGDPVTIAWTKVSGPGLVHISNPGKTKTMVSALLQGVYRFRLTVTDNKGGKAADEVIITVNPGGESPANLPPTAIAGPDQTVSVSGKLLLTGKGYDPDGKIVSYRWEQIDGDNKAVILSPYDSTTAINVADTGLYVFQLTVRDNMGSAATDTMMLKVGPAAPAKKAWIWVGLVAGLLIAAGYWYIIWWRQKEKIIVYFITKEEEALAHALVPDAKQTEGYIVGHASRTNIKEMKKQGLPLRLLNRRLLTVHTPGITRTYKFSFKKGEATLKSVTKDTHQGEFHNLIATLPDLDTGSHPLPSFYMITLDDPLLPQYKEKLKEIGLTVIQKIPVDSYILLVKDEDQLIRLQDKETFGFIRLITPYTTMDTGFFLRKDHVSGSGNGNANWVLDLVLHREEDGLPVRLFLESNKIEMSGFYRNIIRIRIRPDTATAQLLASNKYIQAIYEHIPPVLHNDIARQLIGIDAAPAGDSCLSQTGEGEIIAVADTGIDSNHPDLQGKLTGAVSWGRTGNDTSDPHGHGTHVTGTITGNGYSSGGKIRGMAPGAKIFFQSLLDENGQLCDLELKLPDLLLQAYEQGARILNISWGASTESYYTFDSVAMDQFVYDHPDMLVMVSAGNEAVKRTDDNGNEVVAFGSVGSPATTKNGLTVGASRSSRMQENPEAIAPFSSRGPCKSDRRIKPDIVAPGTDILSTRSGAAPERNFDRFYENAAYVFMGGTSMATPVVSGAAALVREYYRTQKGNAHPGAALVKATLLNGTKQLKADSAMRGSDIIPNNNQGYGLLDMSMTIPHLQNQFTLAYYDSGVAPSLNFQRSGERRQFRLILQQKTWIRACLVFIDNPALGGVQSDLDLIISMEGTVSKWTGNAGINAKDPLFSDVKNDFTNNIEVARIPEAEPSGYIIEVVATSMAHDGNLRFALVVTTGDDSATFSTITV
jgi:subtilisin family serine protease